MPGPIAYRLSLRDPHTHLIEVEMRVPSVSEAVEMVMPSWTPGSYLMREFARHVQDFRAVTTDGGELAWAKRDKNSWRVEAGDARELVVSYRVYANEPSVRTSHLDASHAAVNGASVFLFVRGRESEPLILEIDAPDGWEVATSLGAEGPFHFRARSYDELVDSPLEIGTHRVHEWEQEGIAHRYAIWGSASYDAERLVADTRRIIDAAKRLFGSLPYERYLFIVHLLPEGRGGLEHASSTMLQAGRGFGQGEEYESFLALVAHEFFHVWNAKRIRPARLGPFDYTSENYTRNLWVVEGLTTYYTDLILLRAGIITAERYLARLSDTIARFQALPGRHHQSLAESSFDAWIKFYRPDEHSANSQVSYYQKGALVGMLLDLEIRRATGNQRSLDDLMRLLWARYGALDTGFPEEMREGIQALAEEVCGVSLEGFFQAYIWGTEELDYDGALAVAGLRLAAARPTAKPAPSAKLAIPAADDAPVAPFAPAAAVAAAAAMASADTHMVEARLGIRTRDQAGRARVAQVLEGTPAYDAGVNAGDDVVAVDGVRTGHSELAGRVRGRTAGEKVMLAIFRRDVLRMITVTLGAHPAPRLQIARGDAPSEQQRGVRRSWLAGPGGEAGGGVDRDLRGG